MTPAERKVAVHKVLADLDWSGQIADAEYEAGIRDIAAAWQQDVDAHGPSWSEVEAWLAARRGQHRDATGALTGPWYTLDDALSDLRERRITGTPLGQANSGLGTTVAITVHDGSDYLTERSTISPEEIRAGGVVDPVERELLRVVDRIRDRRRAPAGPAE